MFQQIRIFLLECAFFALVHGQYTPSSCAQSVDRYKANGYFTYDDYWYGEVYGQLNDSKLPHTTLSYGGCRKACGNGASYHDDLTALGILTTWVLPLISLISNLPFENALKRSKNTLSSKGNSRICSILERIHHLEPLVNWIGSPQAALSSILSNISLHIACIQATKKRPFKEKRLLYRDACFVLCCVNQYEYPHYESLDLTSKLQESISDTEGQVERYNRELSQRRDMALLSGLLCPLMPSLSQAKGEQFELGNIPIIQAQSQETKSRRSSSTSLRPSLKKPRQQCTSSTDLAPTEQVLASESEYIMPVDKISESHYSETPSDLSMLPKEQLGILLMNLAHQLRLFRQRGMYPLAISIGWFLVAFAVGLYMCFRNIGDYTTADALGIGVLLSWLPTLVLMSITDRNPNGAGRCKELIERWLYNVEAVLNSKSTNLPPDWWTYKDHCTLELGDYVGQGRFLRYCGVGHLLLQHLKQVDELSEDVTPSDWRINDNTMRRGPSWWFAWLGGQFIVSVAIFMAFTIAFNTPTVGVGCRSFFYLLLWTVGNISWVIHAIFQKPPALARWISLAANTLSTGLFLTLIMLVTGGMFNTCFCQASLFGSKYFFGISRFGGYVVFGDSSFYRQSYRVQDYFIPASTVALSTCVFSLASTLIAWLWCHPLWDEKWTFPEDGERETLGPPSGRGISMDWLT